MKKTFLLAVTAVMALMAASCQKEELGRVLTATIEQYEHSGNAKAYINADNYACWEAGDTVEINNTQCTIRFEEGSQGTANTAIIDGASLPSDVPLLAFYPASQISNLTTNGGTVTLPHIQTYKERNGHQIINNPMAAYCPAGGDELRFRNLCALLKVTITPSSPTYVKAIQVKGIDNQMLWGTTQLKLNNQGLPVLTDFVQGSNSVVLNFASPVQVTDSKSFYIVVPGGALFTNLTIAVLTSDAIGYYCTHHCKTTLLGQGLLRNQIGAIHYTPQGEQDDTYSPDWLIRYTATEEVASINPSAFGGIYYINTYFSNGKGYLLFNGPLTTIGHNAFRSNNFTSIDLSQSGVTSIGDSAFKECFDLTSISLPTNLTSIGSSAFHNCHLITRIDFPATLTSIGNYAFLNCYALTSIDLSLTGVTTIGVSAFESCTTLTRISLSPTLTMLGESAFSHCNALTSIDLPATLDSIGKLAFNFCRALSSIDLSHTRITSIGKSAFNKCTALTRISLPATLTSIGESAFDFCEALTSIDLPPTLTSIEEYAFADCRALTSIDLSHTRVTSIGNGAFWDCTHLVSAHLPATLNQIGGSAFDGCEKLQYVDCHATEPPTLGSEAFNVSNNLTLYVPSSSKETYKNNSNWSRYFGERIYSLP